MNGVKEDLEIRMQNAIQAHCWRVVCARIRDIAKLEQQQHGIPYEDTLQRYGYEHWNKDIKREFEK
jgi:hypothetical protein